MRVIAGTYRGRVLKGPPDNKTRPTSDRLRETLFNILNPQINEDTRFLDLCSGTGAVGIEAISRGAAHATFVELSRRSCAVIEENLDNLGIEKEQTTLINTSAENFAAKETDNGWDIVFYDPPYNTDYRDVLFFFGTNENRQLNPGGVFIAEHHSKAGLPDTIGYLRRWRIVKQGETNLSFYEME